MPPPCAFRSVRCNTKFNNAQQERTDQKSEAIGAFDIDLDELLDMIDLEGV